MKPRIIRTYLNILKQYSTNICPWRPAGDMERHLFQGTVSTTSRLRGRKNWPRWWVGPGVGYCADCLRRSGGKVAVKSLPPANESPVASETRFCRPIRENAQHALTANSQHSLHKNLLRDGLQQLQLLLLPQLLGIPNHPFPPLEPQRKIRVKTWYLAYGHPFIHSILLQWVYKFDDHPLWAMHHSFDHGTYQPRGPRHWGWYAQNVWTQSIDLSQDILPL